MVKKVLVIDDNKDFADVFCDILQSHELEAESCYSGEEAVNRFGENSYDVTFLDIKMPDKDGMETLREIRAIRPEARVIMMTGYSMGQDLQDTLEEYSADIIFKPFDMDKVLDIIRSVE